MATAQRGSRKHSRQTTPAWSQSYRYHHLLSPSSLHTTGSNETLQCTRTLLPVRGDGCPTIQKPYPYDRNVCQGNSTVGMAARGHGKGGP